MPGAGVNPALLEIAEKFVAEVRAGRVSTFGIVCISPLGQITAPAVGPNAADLYIGCDMLKSQIMGAMMGQRPGLKV